MKGRNEDWESELWSYITLGDGIICPLSNSCKLDKKEVRCFNETKEYNKKLYRFVDSDELDYSILDSSEQRFPKCIIRGKIFNLVAKLAFKYLNERWNKSIPVPSNLVLESCDNIPIEVRHVPLRVHHGAIWRLDDCWLIHLNSKDSSARQRYTLYHEIFHIMAHCQGTPVFKKARVEEVYFNEVLADHFASNILLPPEAVKAKWADTKDVSHMAVIFDVPKPIMFMALQNRGLI